MTKIFALLSLLLLAGAAAADVGDTCDPDAYLTSCAQPAGCDPSSQTCPFMVCSSTGTCGVQCGTGPADGNTTCYDGTGAVQSCDSHFDCISPCMVGGAPKTLTSSDCEGVGLLTAWPLDGSCIVPCTFAICGLLGGSC